MNDHRKHSRWWIGVTAALALVGGLGISAAPSAEARSTPDAVQAALTALVRDDKFPGALAAVRGRDGRTRNYTAGVGDLTTRAKVPVDGYVRIGSNTKTFTAVVVLQLVAEGRVGLDSPVETYLPGLLRGDGIDGRRITVRHLLRHQSGLPNYTAFLASGILPYVHTYFQPRQMIDLALADKAAFQPGERWDYSNTNYAVAGLLVEKITGRPVLEEITNRVVTRIGLRHTYFPNVGDQGIRDPHPHGYHTDDPANPNVDVTETDPSFGWAAGQMISTPSDVNRFFAALLAGRLLPPAQLAQMRDTVDAPEMGAGARYGLGLISTPLRCGGLSWGHGGSIQGFMTVNAVTEDGRAATIALTHLPTEASIGNVTKALDTALCT